MIADCVNSIPSLADGLKHCKRKVLHTCFSKKITEDIRVIQLCGYVQLHSAHHYGENVLNSQIISLAQNCARSSNINLLFPPGSFGSRLLGGKDPDDDVLLNYLDDDGLSVQPEFYVPILPLILLNGAEGIGMSWSTSIPNFNPRDIAKNIKCMLRGKEPKEMLPWNRT